MSGRETTNRRRYQLLMSVLQDLIEGQAINWEIVQQRSQAENGKYTADQFFKDRIWLQRTLEQFQKVFDPLGLPIPQAKMTRTSFSLPTRAFVGNFKHPMAEARQRLARAAIAYVGADRKPLIPRSGSTYLGFGSQMYYLAREIMRSSDSFKNSFSTNSFEIATLFYLAGQHTLQQEFYLPGSRLVYEDGLLSPYNRLQKFQTTIISAHSVSEGQLYTSQPTAGALAEKAIKQTSGGRVVVIVDHAKLEQASGGPKIRLPSSVSVLLVTDHPLPNGFQIPRHWEEPLVLN